MYTEQEAKRLGVSGWVRNRPDGSVEVVAEGSSAAVMQLVQWCRKGSPYAHVVDVKDDYSEALGTEQGFVIRS